MAKALAERHAAVERAQEIAADRQAMLDQFKIMSTETLTGSPGPRMPRRRPG